MIIYTISDVLTASTSTVLARPCLHTLLYTALECARVGPGAYYTQFTMERAIADLGQDIRHPSNIFANLGQIALRRSQLGALKYACPELDAESKPSLPQYSKDCGNGIILLRPRYRYMTDLEGQQVVAFERIFDAEFIFYRWGRVQLPNGQVVPSHFAEKGRRPNICVSCNVKPSFLNLCTVPEFTTDVL